MGLPAVTFALQPFLSFVLHAPDVTSDQSETDVIKVDDLTMTECEELKAWCEDEQLCASFYVQLGVGLNSSDMKRAPCLFNLGPMMSLCGYISVRNSEMTNINRNGCMHAFIIILQIRTASEKKMSVRQFVPFPSIPSIFYLLPFLFLLPFISICYPGVPSSKSS